MIGSSAEDSSTIMLSTPRPAAADIRCSTVWILASPQVRPVQSVVSVTRLAAAGTSTTGSRSMRRNTMPWSTGAGRRVM
jgi:hypothetical protein